MRHQPTPAEDALWQRLRSRRLGGARFRRQHAVAGFIVDFVCIAYRLVVEVDGPIHKQDDQREYDAQRQQVLEARGFRVLRFTNADVLQSHDAIAHVIAEALNLPPPSP